MAQNKCHGCVTLEEHIKLAREIKRHKEEVNALKFQMSEYFSKCLTFGIDVLKEIRCIDADFVVQIKGRVACEMNSGEEFICTDCLFENQLDDFKPEEAVAIMSASLFQQRNTSEPSLMPKLSLAKKRSYDTGLRVGQLQAQFNLQVDLEEYVKENLKFSLVEVVHEWAKGIPAAYVCELTDVPEGLIVRTIVRLDETCRKWKLLPMQESAISALQLACQSSRPCSVLTPSNFRLLYINQRNAQSAKPHEGQLIWRLYPTFVDL